MARTNLTDAVYSVLADFDPTVFALVKAKINEHDTSLDAIGAPTTMTETKTSGALTLTTQISYLSITGTVAFTLADGTIVGQTKEIECSVVSGTPLGTVTIATPNTTYSEPATHVFTALGQRLKLIWLAAGWHVISKVRAGRQAIVVGTTDTTGLDMCLAYDLSVTGTVHSTGSTKKIPNGQIAGERIHIDVLTAAISATGDIDITAKTTVGVSATSWGGSGTSLGSAGTNTTAVLDAVWDGAAWQAVVVTTATLA
jgi:hypothetical protein